MVKKKKPIKSSTPAAAKPTRTAQTAASAERQAATARTETPGPQAKGPDTPRPVPPPVSQSSRRDVPEAVAPKPNIPAPARVSAAPPTAKAEEKRPPTVAKSVSAEKRTTPKPTNERKPIRKPRPVPPYASADPAQERTDPAPASTARRAEPASPHSKDQAEPAHQQPVRDETEAEPATASQPSTRADEVADHGSSETHHVSEPFQDFATEAQRMARETFDETTNLLGKLRGAKNPVEIVLLQTSFLQQSLRMYTEFAQRFGKLMAASQTTLMKQGQATIESLGSMTKKL